MSRSRSAFALASAALFVAVAAVAGGARAGGAPVEHEPIPPDPREDLALHVALEGNLPAAIEAPHAAGGVVGAPDPARPPAPDEVTYGLAGVHDAFTPDTDTRRPDVSDYDDPFTPSTTPFKRLEAFDSVRSDYQVEVRDPRLVALASLQNGAPPRTDEDAFYADLVVDVPPEGTVRIPSVGPGARVVRARLGIGATEIPFRVLRDGADNWFLQPTAHFTSSALPTRARLVMEVAIARAAFGGSTGDVSWAELPFVAPLPDDVAHDAARVRAAIGVSRSMRPREAIAKLVDYFRGFAESDEPPRGRGSVYLDLALSRKGVCRHRAYAFLITAESLGIPARLVENEAHAWVEIHDGLLWRRVDLGGAGRMAPSASGPLTRRDAYTLPPDAFPWPGGAHRGDEMVAKTEAGKSGGPGGPNGGQASGNPGAMSAAHGGGANAPGAPDEPRRDADDHRPTSSVSLVLAEPVVHRGLPLRVRGEVRADGEPCAHVSVEISLRASIGGSRAGATRTVFLGAIATGDDGSYEGTVIPTGAPLGDYDLVAETHGDARCGPGWN
jgi:transglutaminase-like putative cysteine protease